MQCSSNSVCKTPFRHIIQPLCGPRLNSDPHRVFIFIYCCLSVYHILSLTPKKLQQRHSDCDSL